MVLAGGTCICVIGLEFLVSKGIQKNVCRRQFAADRIQQRAGKLIFSLGDFDMERISALYARPEYKGFLKVEAGSTPRVSLRLKSNTSIVDQARKFIKEFSQAL